MSKKSRVSEEDSALFRQTVGPVTPIQNEETVQPSKRRPRPAGNARGRAPPEPAAARRQPHGYEPPRARPHTAGLSTETPPGGPGLEDATGASLSFLRPGLQGRVFRRLKRGQLGIQDRLDLHGMTADEASARLAGFLARAQANQLRCVLIIHGKGRSSGHGGPRLKALVNRWLRLRPEVSGFCSAQPRDGGTGALYVLLRGA